MDSVYIWDLYKINSPLSRVAVNRRSIEITRVTEQDPMCVFKYALRSSESQRQYPGRLKVFLDYAGFEGTIENQAREFVKKIARDPRWLQESFMNFTLHQKERVKRKEISEGTIGNYYKAVKLFCEMNFDHPVVNWKKIALGMPRARKFALDRIPTLEEIRRLCGHKDRRIKAIVYTMVSSGIRVGAFDYLQWKHIDPIKNSSGDVMAARMTIYPGDPVEEYTTFSTPEAYNEIKSWMDFREQCGERISGESWVMRDVWQTSDMDYGAKFGSAENPRKLESVAVKRIIERGLWEQGIRKSLLEGKKHHEWKAAHGFRKYFKTKAEQAMMPLHVEMLLGHDTGLSMNYYRPSMQTLLQDYLKAVDVLTINGDTALLQKQLEELNKKTKDNEHTVEEVRDALSAVSDELVRVKAELKEARDRK